MKWYLDFGHGGKNPGALGSNNTKESDVVLKIGMLIKKNLEEAFEKVITTREDDKYYSLDYRSSIGQPVFFPKFFTKISSTPVISMNVSI